MLVPNPDYPPAPTVSSRESEKGSLHIIDIDIAYTIDSSTLKYETTKYKLQHEST